MKPLALLIALLLASPAAAQAMFARAVRTSCSFPAAPPLHMLSVDPSLAGFMVSSGAGTSTIGFINLSFTRPRPGIARWRGLAATATIAIYDPRLGERAVTAIRIYVDNRPTGLQFPASQVADTTHRSRFNPYVESRVPPADIARLLDRFAAGNAVTLVAIGPAGAVALREPIPVDALRNVPAALAASNWHCP